MSLKAQEFANIIVQPANTYNFIVDIPGVAMDLLVESTSYPAEKLGTTSLHYQGEEVPYPVIPKMAGKWSVKVPESDTGIVRESFDAIKSKHWNQKTGLLNPVGIYRDITVTARDMADNHIFKVVLHRAFILGRNQVQLDNSRPEGTWHWDYEFQYTWIEDISEKED